MKAPVLALLVLLGAAALAAAASNNRPRAFPQPLVSVAIPPGWTRLAAEEPDENTKLSFVIALKQRNLETLSERFRRVSNPDSKEYQNFMTTVEISSLIAPSEQEINRVVRWLEVHNVQDFEVSRTRDLIKFTTDADTAERLLDVDFQRFENDVTGRRVIRAVNRYSVPAELSSVIQLIGGVHGLSSASVQPIWADKRRREVNQPLMGVNPSVVRKFFSVPNNLSAQSPNNLQATASFLGQYFSASDLTTFQKQNSLPVQVVSKIVGPNDDSNPGMEGQLDIEYMMGLAPGVPTQYISFGDLHENQEPFLEWAQYLSSLPDGQLPLVNSVSYGDDEDSIDITWAKRIDVEYQKLGLRGVSVTYASGDAGVGCNHGCTRHVPTWPATSPFVTAVGGVMRHFAASDLTGDSISSGGFSNFYPMPDWQVRAVKQYLTASNVTMPPPSFYNASSRATPDVAAFSQDVDIVIGGQTMPIGGTSCASPMFAGMMSMINDALLQAGKKPLGFLNPLLYKLAATNPSVFIDITKGSNPKNCCPGFRAAPGWDAITGLGAINFQNLKTAILSMHGIKVN